MDLNTAQLLGNLGEFVAAIAVMVTLVYLAIQLRQSNLLAVANAYQARSDSNIAVALGILQSPVNRIVSSDEEPPPELEGAYHAMMEATFVYFENNHFQRGIELISDEQWQASRNAIRFFFRKQATRGYWEDSRERFSASFREEVDNVLGEYENA